MAPELDVKAAEFKTPRWPGALLAEQTDEWAIAKRYVSVDGCELGIARRPW